MKVFYLVRDEDETGVSGTGTVAEGIIFHDGQVAMSWKTEISSMGLYSSIRDVEYIHGHGGKTRVVIIDEF